MKLSEFDFELDKSFIAQYPAQKRDESRLMVIHKSTGEIEHKRFFDLPDLLTANDILVMNDTRVIPARILGEKETGGKIEILFLKERARNQWEVLIGGKLKIGREIKIRFYNEHRIEGEIKELIEIMILEDLGNGRKILEFKNIDINTDILNKIGHIPIPPYIERNGKNDIDRDRYQTVYSRVDGAIAAPTAGLHFTDDLLNKLRLKGIETYFITLHVGTGTFKPVKTEEIEEHIMENEYLEVKDLISNKINYAKSHGKRIIAVGTTATRGLESAISGNKSCEFIGYTNLFIIPGFDFKIVEGLITNFHLPKSTLLMLVSAFAGSHFIKNAYVEAIKNNYRFYSYGDAMLII